MIDLKSIKQVDPELYASMLQELERQQHNLELIASENIVSEAVLAAAGTFYTNKYAEGYPGKRYYGGCEYVDIAEKLAIERAKQLFGVKYANVQPHCGSNANFAAYYALLDSGDTILGMTLADGGHLTHGAKVNMSGKLFNCVGYGIDPQTELINYDEVRRIALECKPKLIVAGASAYPRFIDYKKFREIADEVGAYLMAGYGARCRYGCGRSASKPRRICARYYNNDAQDVERAQRRSYPLRRRRYRKEDRQGDFPRFARRSAYAYNRGKSGCFQRGSFARI